MSDSNTTPKQRGGITGKGFVKGDPRINRKGRPKTFDALRAEAVKIAGEILTATGPDGTKVEASRIHTIMLDWATSKDPRKQALFVEYAFGKVPARSEAPEGEAKTVIRVVYENRDNQTNPTTPSTGADQE